MLRNYLLTAYRTLRRRPGYTFINVFGLAVGMAACLVIGLYVADELSYDAFHEKSDRLMAVVTESDFISGQTTPYPLADALAESVPEVERVVRTHGTAGEVTVRRTDGGFERAQDVLTAESTFFEVFSFPLTKGNPAAVLDAPQQAVITEAMARAFFGEIDPVGQTLTFERRGETHTVTVTGVAQNPPSNSTIQFDMVVPIALAPPSAGASAWGSFSWFTYALLDRPMDADAFAAQVKRALAPRAEESPLLSEITFPALPLSQLYLSDYYDASGFAGQLRYVYLFGTIALLILFIAAINYVNLVTAQGEGRAKEVGVRKAVGAQREQLAGQFLGETALLSVASLVIALVLVGVALPGFNTLLGTELSLEAARKSWALPGLTAFVLAVSVAAGAYPAFVLSRFRPVEVLRGRGSAGSPGGRWLRRGLVVFQFAVSAGLILCTAVIYQQLRFVQQKNLGFEGEQIVTVALPVDEARQQTIKRAVLQQPGVARATVADAVPGGFNITFSNEPKSISSAAQTEREEIPIRPSKVDADYVETMGLKLLAGRGFRTGRPSDRTQGYVLNRAAAEAMGWSPETAVGQPFTFARGENAPEGNVIGVVENFHIESLRDPIAPVVLQMEMEGFSSSGGILAARIAPEQIGAAMERIERVLSAQMPDEAFEYTFLDEKFDAMYRSETRIAQIFAVFAGLAVLVACLGLFGLAAFAAERRTKEIAIRKALGASTRSIVGLLSKEFLTLVAVALVIGTPVAWWGVERWLEDFAYQAGVGPWMFALTAATAFLIAGAATSYHALRAALSNPAQALRDE